MSLVTGAWVTLLSFLGLHKYAPLRVSLATGLILIPVPHVLHLRALLSVHQQPLSLSIIRILQRVSHHHRLHPLLRCLGAFGYNRQAVDEHP